MEKQFEFICDYCKNKFSISNKQMSKIRIKPDKGKFCSLNCHSLSRIDRIEVKCSQCNEPFKKLRGNYFRSKNHFCSRSCSATYNNQHKRHGNRRSKLEQWLERELTSIYPELEIHYNRKDAINSELDIYIPSLRLAFELNGIYHYEPIHGQEKLEKIKNNDNRKFQACIERSIELCLIDISSQNYFKESTSKKYIDIILHIIKSKLALGEGLEPSTLGLTDRRSTFELSESKIVKDIILRDDESLPSIN